MHPYRTHDCGALRRADVGRTVRLSGWVHRKRDHGSLLFADLRDRYGLTQCVIDSSRAETFALLDAARNETVLTITGECVERDAETVNPALPTGEVEVSIREIAVLGAAEPLPLQVNSDEDYGEEVRLQIPLPRPPPRQDAAQYRAALRHHRLDPPAHDRTGLPRVPDADPDGGESGGRAGLPRALAAASWQFLRTAAGTAAVQAIADDRGLRPLFPDRALLPRRGCPRRPLAGRVLPARLRDGVRHPGGRIRRHRAGARRGVRGIRGRPQASRRRPSRASASTTPC